MTRTCAAGMSFTDASSASDRRRLRLFAAGKAVRCGGPTNLGVRTHDATRGEVSCYRVLSEAFSKSPESTMSSPESSRESPFPSPGTSTFGRRLLHVISLAQFAVAFGLRGCRLHSRHGVPSRALTQDQRRRTRFQSAKIAFQTTSLPFGKCHMGRSGTEQSMVVPDHAISACIIRSGILRRDSRLAPGHGIAVADK